MREQKIIRVLLFLLRRVTLVMEGERMVERESTLGYGLDGRAKVLTI